MRNWVLHHMHFVILMDALLHLVIIGFAIAATIYFFKFVQAVRNHPNTTSLTNGISYTMLPLVGIMDWSCVQAFYHCLIQYPQWWSR